MRTTTLAPLTALVLAASSGALFAVACGGSSPPPVAAAPAPSSTGTIRPLTQAQVNVAHYQTADGVYGLVLDRTGPKPKYQVDGQADIVELTMTDDRFGGDLRGYYLVAPDGKRPLYISTGGGIAYFHGNDELPLSSDRPADPLPAATKTGTYVPPPPVWKATSDRLAAISVLTKLSGFKPEDAANLSRVGDALSQATADMFVHFQSGGTTEHLPRPELVPDTVHGTGFGGVAYETDDKWDPKAKGLAKHGGKNEGFSHYDTPKGNHMQVVHLAGYPAPMADGTPGLVWSVRDSSAVFVTLDGARYAVDLSHSDKGPTLAAGAGPASGWPAFGQAALLDVPGVTSLVKAGALPQKNADDVLALDDAWNQCAAKTWAGAQRKIDSGAFTEADNKDWTKKVRDACTGPVKKQEALLLQIVEARLKDRATLLDKAKARVAQVGADK
jgi:hypothetical protein